MSRITLLGHKPVTDTVIGRAKTKEKRLFQDIFNDPGKVAPLFYLSIRRLRNALSLQNKGFLT